MEGVGFRSGEFSELLPEKNLLASGKGHDSRAKYGANLTSERQLIVGMAITRTDDDGLQVVHNARTTRNPHQQRWLAILFRRKTNLYCKERARSSSWQADNARGICIIDPSSMPSGRVLPHHHSSIRSRFFTAARGDSVGDTRSVRGVPRTKSAGGRSRRRRRRFFPSAIPQVQETRLWGEW